MMKIRKEDLEKLIKECVSSKLKSIPQKSLNETKTAWIGEGEGFNWDQMKFLYARGKLHGKWHVIMEAFREAKEDEERTLAILRAAVATLEAKKIQNPKPAKEEEPASMEDLTDFSKLV